MTEREIVEYETVRKTKTIRVCDSCGTAENELPDDSGDFSEVYEDIYPKSAPLEHPDKHTEIISRRLNEKHVGSIRAVVCGKKRDLCPICYGAVFATVGETA